MRSIHKIIKRYWIVIWLAVAVALFMGVIAVYADYTQVTTIKRVVSTVKDQVVRFSSNIMTEAYPVKAIASNDYQVSVCNYPRDAFSLYSEETINYTLNAYLASKDGTPLDNNSAIYDLNQFYISKTVNDSVTITNPSNVPFTYDGEKYSLTITGQQLGNGRSVEDYFKVHIPDASDETEDQICVYIEAKRDDNSSISALLFVQKNSHESSAWQGRVQESGDSDYDFYNYAITGSGEGTLTVTWNPATYKISEHVLTLYSDDINNSTDLQTGRLVLNVDTDRDRYEFQIFKVDQRSSYTAEEVNSAFTYNFVKA